MEHRAASLRLPARAPELDGIRATARTARTSGQERVRDRLRAVLSPATARPHVSRSMVKLRARDRAQVVVIA